MSGSDGYPGDFDPLLLTLSFAMANSTSQSMESRLVESTTTDKLQLDVSATERDVSRDEQDTTPAETKSGVATDSDYVPQPRKPSCRFRMSNNWKAELLATEVPDIMPVKCGDLEGELHVQLLGSGSRGPCIFANEQWLTPNQFECKGGHGYFRYWKRSIRHDMKPLDCYLKLGLIKLHPRFCSCNRCSAPIINAPQRLRLNKGKKRKRDREEKESNESPSRDDGLGMSESETHSEAESSNEEGKPWQDGSRSSGTESVKYLDHLATDVATTVTHGAPRGKKRSRLEQLLEDGHRTSGTRKSKLSCDSRLVKDVDKRLPLESRKRKQQGSAPASSRRQKLPHTEVAVTLDATSSPATNRSTVSRYARREDSTYDWMSAKTLQSEDTRRELFPVHERQSFDLDLVASASASMVDLNSTRSLRSQKSANIANKVGGTPERSMKHSIEKHNAGSNPANAGHSSQSQTLKFSDSRRTCVMSPRDMALRSRILAAVQNAGVENNVKAWSVDDVAAFMRNAGFKFQSSVFREHLINGEALLRVQEKHLLETFKIKLGTALCLFAVIQGLQLGLAGKAD